FGAGALAGAIPVAPDSASAAAPAGPAGAPDGQQPASGGARTAAAADRLAEQTEGAVADGLDDAVVRDNDSPSPARRRAAPANGGKTGRKSARPTATANRLRKYAVRIVAGRADGSGGSYEGENGAAPTAGATRPSDAENTRAGSADAAPATDRLDHHAVRCGAFGFDRSANVR